MSRERDRIGMRLDLTQPIGNVPLPPGYAERRTGTADTHGLLELSIAAYRGSVDEVDAAKQSEDITATLSGLYGAFDVGASRVAVTADDQIVAAVLITHYKDRPLLADAMVHPDHRGKGIGSTLILSAARALSETEYTDLVLVVTRTNPAQRVYERLGFKDWPREEAGRAPSS